MKTIPKFHLLPPLAALLLAGCDSQPEQKVCVDQATKTRVADARCDANGNVAGSYYGPGGAGHGGGFFWFYMGRNGYLPPVGSYVSPGAGSYTPRASFSEPASSSSSSSSGASSGSVSRGGFGSTGHSFGGGASS